MFLNLFIAIMIDAFSGQSDIAKMAVNDEVLHDFKEHWAKYDPDAKGFISIHDLKHLMWDLADAKQNKGGALIIKKKSIHKDNYRCYMNIAELGIPTFKGMKKVMFHDVLIKLCLAAVKSYFQRIDIKAMH